LGTRFEDRDAVEPERALIRSRAVRLLEYLEAVRGLREQPVRDVAEYQDRRWWAWELPAHPSCVLTATGDEPWLTVSKAQVPPAPLVPDDIAAYLRTGVTDPEVEPEFGPDFDDVFAGDPDEAERLRSFLRDYLAGPWGAWVPPARTALRARKLYEDLYDLRLRLQRESALIELVWGHGILSWTVDGTKIVHPMVTTQVQLSFDAETGAISVQPESLAAHLEIDLLQGLDVKGFDLLVNRRDQFRTDPVGPFESRCPPRRRARMPGCSGLAGAEPFGVTSGAVRGQAGPDQFGARCDAELGEDLAQVVFDRARAEEQMGGDLAIGQALGGQARDLEFLRRQPVQCRGLTVASGLAGGAQLRFGALCPRDRAQGTEQPGGGAQVRTCLRPFPVTAQPLAVEQFGAGPLERREGVRQPSSLGEQLIWRALCEQRLATCQQRAPRAGGHLSYPGAEPCQRRLDVPGRPAGPHVRLHRVRDRNEGYQRIYLG
jgi:hypothetical protein